MWELDYKENWVPKNWCFWTVVLEKTLESPLDCKEIKPINPKGNKSLIFIGRTDAEAEIPVLWPADTKNWLIWKHPDAGKDWRWEEKGTTEDEMFGWHHQLWELVMERQACMLQSMGLQRVGHNRTTELKWLIIGLFYPSDGLLQLFLKWLFYALSTICSFSKTISLHSNFFSLYILLLKSCLSFYI